MAKKTMKIFKVTIKRETISYGYLKVKASSIKSAKALAEAEANSAYFDGEDFDEDNYKVDSVEEIDDLEFADVEEPSDE